MKTKIFTSFKTLSLFAIILSITLSSLIGGSVNARTFNRDEGRGYFTNNSITAGFGQGSNVLYDGIYSSDINNFVSAIKGHLNAGGRRRTAASFIINTMLGNMTGASSWRDMTSSDAKVATWEARVRDYASHGLIIWNDRRGTDYNTFYSSNDIAWYSAYTSDTRITFLNTNGAPLYQIRKDCGNPVGTLTGLPTLSNWSSTRNSYVSVDNATVNGTNGEGNPLSVYPGQTVRFRHDITATGLGIDYSTNINGTGHPDANFNGSSLYNHTLLSGRTGNTNHTVSTGNRTQMTFSASDIGTTYCQRAWVNRISHTSGTGNWYSDWRCVKVISRPWTLTISTNIKKDSEGWSSADDIEVYPGQTIDWQHIAANNTDHEAPGVGNNKSWQSFGYYMLYGATSRPNNSTSEDAWIRFDLASRPRAINARSSISTTASSSTYDTVSSDGGMSPNPITNSHSRNNNGKPPTHYTATTSDIGKYFCQRLYIGRRTPNDTSQSRTDWKCARVVARPWELTTRSRVRTDSSGSAYVDRSGDLNAKVGENAYWQHSLINNTGHTAPSDTGSHGFASFGYSLHYNLDNNSNFNPNNQYVRRIGGTNMRSVGNNTTLDYYASETGAEGIYGLGSVYGQDTNGTNLNYGRNNDGQVPVHKLIRPGDVGKRFCQRGYIGRNKDATLGGTLTYGNISCVYVPYDYQLRPCMVIGSTTTCGGVDIPQERGTTATPQPRVNNDGGTVTRDTNWKVSQWVVPASRESAATPNTNTDNTNSDPCAVYNGVYGVSQAQSGCSVTHQGTRQFNSTTTLTGQINNLTIPDDAELGSRYCFALSINPYSFNENQTKAEQDAAATRWRHSPPVCILVVKYPKMQVWSNGIYSAGGIRTHRSTINGETFGSWVEYEALATGQITGFASAATNRFSSENPDRLTLSNNRTEKGNWGAWSATSVSSVISNLETRYPYGATPGSATTFREVPNRNAAVMRTTASRYTLSSNPYASTPGKTIIIMAGNTDIDITGNIISRTPTNGNVSEFQQIIIIGRNIRIASNVERVDAWLISSGDIVTCAQSSGGVLTTSPSFVNQANCGRSLRVNGPIISNSLKSWRTGGGDVGDLDAPSEIYNQRPDTYIWAYGQSGGYGKIITTYSKELPARF